MLITESYTRVQKGDDLTTLRRPVNARFFSFFPPCNGRKNAQIIWLFTGFEQAKGGPDVRVELQEHGLSLGDSKSKPVI